MKEVIIYTDGSCSGNPGPGGWASLLKYNNSSKIISGGEADTTNNRMELTAVISALAQLKEPCKIELFTDSKYVQQGASEWMKKWQLNNWRKGNTIVKNVDLWQKLAELIVYHKVEFIWVKAHADNEYNNLVDRVAREKSKEFFK